MPPEPFGSRVRWYPFLSWMGLIFFLSHQSFGPPSDPLPWYHELLKQLAPLPLDKVVHFILYAILALLGTWPLPHRPWLLFFICVGYGAFDEWHQSFVPTRHPDIWDLTADAVGSLSAILIMSWSLRLKSQPVQSLENKS